MDAFTTQGPSRPGSLTADLAVSGPEGLPTLVRAFAEQVGADSALLAAWRPGADETMAVAGWGLPSSFDAAAVMPGHLGLSRLSRRESGLFPFKPADLPWGETRTGPKHILSAPLRAPEPLNGLICAGYSNGGPVLAENKLRWISVSYAATASLCLNGSALLGALVEAARRDGLTGALNFAGLTAALELEIARSERHGHNLACLFMDLDGFKAINDEHGHMLGNEVLVAVARTLDQSVRGCDVVARYGGDEFVIALPETDPAVARILARRLRVEIGKATQRVVGTPVAATVGVAAWESGVSAGELLALADASLLVARADPRPIGELQPKKEALSREHH